ncbi:MAG: 8-amino-7-oxononanoate synthase [Bdellovibrionales bacterium]|nr:8-amino-7-oxononanoate synthase [Bdellovibrionales bacterium]
MRKKENTKNINRYLIEWEKELQQLTHQNLNRKWKIPKGLDFSSNDYLSLAHHAGIRKSLIQVLKKNLPLSAGASRLIRGHTPWHEETEYLFKKYVRRESALFFSSGYMANLGLIPTLCKNSVIFSDQMNHASLIDGCRLSRRPCHIYPHKDINKLEHLLKKEKHKNKVIITESLFSMDGDFAPLEELSELALKYQTLLIVDEAHATGVYGPKGMGLCGLLKEKEHIISIHPCGKAISASGAFIAGPAILKKYLINKCRSFIYTTAPSPVLLFHIQCVLNTLKKEYKRRELLKKKVFFFRNKIKNLAHIGDSESMIIPIITGSANSALTMEKALQKKGYDIRAIRYPTVAKGKERLRICIHYDHTYKQLKELSHVLKLLLS